MTMSDIVDAVSKGSMTIEIDAWGGIHIKELPQPGWDEPLSLDPSLVQRVIDARERSSNASDTRSGRKNALEFDSWEQLMTNSFNTNGVVKLPEGYEMEDAALINPALAAEAFEQLAEVTDTAYVAAVPCENEKQEWSRVLLAQTRGFEQLGAAVAPVNENRL